MSNRAIYFVFTPTRLQERGRNKQEPHSVLETLTDQQRAAPRTDPAPAEQDSLPKTKPTVMSAAPVLSCQETCKQLPSSGNDFCLISSVCSCKSVRVRKGLVGDTVSGGIMKVCLRLDWGHFFNEENTVLIFL